MEKVRNPILFIAIGLLLISVGYFAGFSKKFSLSPSLPPNSLNSPIPNPSVAVETAKVTRVIDGDTIEIEGGKRVRLIGIDTPEINRTGPTACFGIEAKNYANKLLNGQMVRLEKDVSEVDRYNRLLRYIYLGDIIINDKMVRDGYARVYTYPPDVRYKDRFLDSEKYARENNLGLWSACSTSPSPNSLISPNSPNCSSNSYNCSDFKTQAEAQNVFDYCMKSVGYDVHKLDRDGDGKVCETLP